LGKPWRFYRGFNNLRYSPVCREGLGIAIYMGMLGLHFLCAVLLNPIGQSLLADFAGIVLTDKMNDGLQLAFTYSAYIALSSALIGLYYMYKCYRIPARPFWNHWQVATSFFGNGLSLGAVLCGLFLLPSLSLDESAYSNTLNITGGMLILGLSLEAIGLYVHRYDMLNANNEGSASHYIQTSTFGKTYLLRNCLIGFTIFCGILSLALGQNDLAVLLLITWSLLAVFTVISSLIGRSLFYVLVIPTTMPGAFFWKNKGFEEHAQDIGLANMPQVGVLNRH
jgi:DMSO reductase anchor subunit